MTYEKSTFRFFGSALVALNHYEELTRYITTVVPSPDTEITKESGEDLFERIRIVQATIGGAVEDAAEVINTPDAPDTIRDLVAKTCDILASWKDRLDWLTLGIENIIWTQSTGYIDRLLNDIRETASGINSEPNECPIADEDSPEPCIEDDGCDQSADDVEVIEISDDPESCADEGNEQECDGGTIDHQPSPEPDDESTADARVYTQEEVDRIIRESVANALRLVSEQSEQDAGAGPEKAAGTKVTKKRTPRKSTGLRRKKKEEAVE